MTLPFELGARGFVAQTILCSNKANNLEQAPPDLSQVCLSPICTHPEEGRFRLTRLCTKSMKLQLGPSDLLSACHEDDHEFLLVQSEATELIHEHSSDSPSVDNDSLTTAFPDFPFIPLVSPRGGRNFNRSNSGAVGFDLDFDSNICAFACTEFIVKTVVPLGVVDRLGVGDVDIVEGGFDRAPPTDDTALWSLKSSISSISTILGGVGDFEREGPAELGLVSMFPTRLRRR